MTTRTTRTSITFLAPFQLPGFETLLPAGTYHVETDGEAIEGNGHMGFHRTVTTLQVPTGAAIEHHSVDPEHLDAASQRDKKAAREPVAPPSPVPPPASGRWVSLWVRNTPTDGSR